MAKTAGVAGRTPDDLDVTRAASAFLTHYVLGMGEKRTPTKWGRDDAPKSAELAS